MTKYFINTKQRTHCLGSLTDFGEMPQVNGTLRLEANNCVSMFQILAVE